MRRIPEPELMDDPEQAAAYAAADFSDANRLFLALFAEKFPGHEPRQVVDLGCGPGDIPLAFARRQRACRVVGVDGSAAMLAIARRQRESCPELRERVDFRLARLPGAALPAGFDTVLSNSLLHHLADPLDLWREVRRLGNPGAAVLVMDLIRPRSEDEARDLVHRYAAGAPPVLQRDFFHSLRAAYTVAEVRSQLVDAELAGFEVAPVSDRHLAVWGRLP